MPLIQRSRLKDYRVSVELSGEEVAALIKLIEDEDTFWTFSEVDDFKAIQEAGKKFRAAMPVYVGKEE